MEGQKFIEFARSFRVSQYSLPILLVEQIASSESEDTVFKTIPADKDTYMLPLKGRQMRTKPMKNAVVFSFHNFERSIRTGISVGRASMSKITLQDNAISKMHASLKLNLDGKWQIVDVESENKIRINGKVIEPNKPVLIENGTGITFADSYHCTFFMPEGFKAYLDSLR